MSTTVHRTHLEWLQPFLNGGDTVTARVAVQVQETILRLASWDTKEEQRDWLTWHLGVLAKTIGVFVEAFQAADAIRRMTQPADACLLCEDRRAVADDDLCQECQEAREQFDDFDDEVSASN